MTATKKTKRQRVRDWWLSMEPVEQRMFMEMCFRKKVPTIKRIPEFKFGASAYGILPSRKHKKKGG